MPNNKYQNNSNYVITPNTKVTNFFDKEEYLIKCLRCNNSKFYKKTIIDDETYLQKTIYVCSKCGQINWKLTK